MHHPMIQNARTQWMVLFGVVTAAVILQLPLVLNPGYFSHDELQWAAFAAESPGSYFRRHLWLDLQSFQYRPLTFSIWLCLSDLLFDHPSMFHLVTVAWGSLNAAMLALLLRRFGLSMRLSVAGALVFVLSPYTAYTHGWVGTIGDLIWVGCALGVGLIAQGQRQRSAVLVGSAVLTALGLLSKESAVSIPALAWLGWLLLGRPRSWLAAAVGASIPVGAYLALRLGVILFSPREASAYGWGLAMVPVRWVEYQAFPWLIRRIEMVTLWQGESGRPRFWVAMAIWACLAVTYWRLGARWLTAFLLLGFAALGPVLILVQASNQYGYGFAAVMAGLGAAAWPHARRIDRIVLVVAALGSTLHGAQVMRRVHHVGQLQAAFSPDLAQAVRQAREFPVKLYLTNKNVDWVYARLTHEIPSYHGTPIGDRVVLVPVQAEADYVIGQDGHLSPVPR